MNTLVSNPKSVVRCPNRLSFLSSVVLAVVLAQAAAPAAADCDCRPVFIIRNGETCSLSADCEVEYLIIFGSGRLYTESHTLTVTKPGGLIIVDAAGKLFVNNGSGAVRLTGGGTSVMNGLFVLEADSSTLEIAGSDHALVGSGAIIGLNSSADILIGDGLTFTSEITIEGMLQIVPSIGAGPTRFINGAGGLVHATRAGTLDLNVDALDDGTNTSPGDWQVSTNASALLKFSTGSALLSGNFNVSAGTLDIDDDVTTIGDLTFTGGKIDVASGKSFSAKVSSP